MATKSYKGRYVPKFPQKYKGEYTNIVFRSLWERRMMKFFDLNPNILEWSSEPFGIPYISPVDGGYHKYYPDFYIKILRKDNTTKEFIVEVKPAKQTKVPVKPVKLTKRTNQRYLEEAKTFGINITKWKAAQDYCKTRNWEFIILTEKEIYNKHVK